MNTVQKLDALHASNGLCAFSISPVFEEGRYTFEVVKDENFANFKEITNANSDYKGKTIVTLLGELTDKKGNVLATSITCIDADVLASVDAGATYELIMTVEQFTDKAGKERKRNRTTWLAISGQRSASKLAPAKEQETNV